MSADPGQTPSGIPSAPDTRPSILLVEDNTEVRLMAATLLEEEGFEVHQACDADEAMALARTGLVFDLFFTDVVIPGDMDGVALAAEVRRLQPGVPVLLTTGWADRADDRGGLDLIGKPYRAPELTRKIRALLSEAESPV